MRHMRRMILGHGALMLALGGCPANIEEGEGETDPVDDSAATATACDPGQAIDCACTDGSMSTQVCNADGTAYGECMCGPGEGTSADGSGGTSGTTTDPTTGQDSSTDATATATDDGTGTDGTTDPGCTPGTANACDGCPDGPGFQYCNDAGELSPCQCCEGVHPLVEGELRYCERGWCYCGDLQAMPPVDACFEMVIAEVCCPGDIVLECY